MFKKVFFIFLLLSFILVIIFRFQNFNKLDTWIGEYEFFEIEQISARPENALKRMRVYNILIYKDGKNYYAKIAIDGFQSLERSKTKVIGNKNHVKFIFEESLTGSITGRHNKNDLLLEFKIEDSKLYTYWEKIAPLLYDNEKPGIYFTPSKLYIVNCK